MTSKEAKAHCDASRCNIAIDRNGDMHWSGFPGDCGSTLAKNWEAFSDRGEPYKLMSKQSWIEFGEMFDEMEAPTWIN